MPSFTLNHEAAYNKSLRGKVSLFCNYLGKLHMVGNQTVRYFIKIIKEAKELNSKEKEILIARLQEKTLEKIGKKYKLSAERIRQIEEKAIDRFLDEVAQLFLFD